MYISLPARGVPTYSLLRSSPMQRKVLASLIVITALMPAQAHEPDWDQGGEWHINQSINSSHNITLQQPLTLDVNGNHVVRLRGMVSGPSVGVHALIKNGSGRLELWGDNRGMEKQVVVREGTLHLAGRYALGQDWWASLYAHAGTTLSYEADAIVAASLHLQDAVSNASAPGYDPTVIQWRVDNGIATQIGAIHGATPLVKLGTGTLRLSGAAILPESRLTIAEGAVQLESQFSGHVDVLDATTLRGSGRAGWLTVGSGGILAPTGRLTIDNALHLHPDSQLHIRTWADGQHDSVHVTHGTAELNGHVLVLPQGKPESWQHGVQAVILQVSEGLGAGRFTSVASALPYLEPELSYGSHQVVLHLRPRPDGLPPLPKGQSPGWTASLRSMIIDDSRFIRDAVYSQSGADKDFENNPGTARRFASNDHMTRHGLKSKRGAAGIGFWTHAFHSSGERRAHGQTNADERRISGLLQGVNLDVTPVWRIGAYAGFSHTDATERNFTTTYTAAPANIHRASAKVDSVHLGLYTHHTTTWNTRLTAGAAQSWHRLRSQRAAVTPMFQDGLSSHYRARTAQIFAKAEHPLWASRDQDTSIQSFARLAWVQTQQDKHTESGGPLALHTPPDHTTVLFSSLGLTASHYLELPQGGAILTGEIAWRHAGGNTHTPVRQHFRDDIHRTPFSVPGLPVARQAWQLRMGVQARIGKQAQLSMHYAGQRGRGRQDHGVRVGVIVGW